MEICEFCGAEIGPVICCLTRFLVLECLHGDEQALRESRENGIMGE